MNLAARQIGMSRRTLDNYLLEFQKARVLGYDFARHFDARISEMRKYIKKF